MQTLSNEVVDVVAFNTGDQLEARGQHAFGMGHHRATLLGTHGQNFTRVAVDRDAIQPAGRSHLPQMAGQLLIVNRAGVGEGGDGSGNQAGDFHG
jgi:hypothetical protein